MRKSGCIFLLAALIASGLGFSQSDQTGSITGVIRTPEGDPLPGVIVLLKSPALILPELEAVSNKAGVYRFPGLSPGIYELCFIVRGLETYVRRGIFVSAGKRVYLDINLPLKAPHEAIVVEGKAPVVDRLKMEGVKILDASGEILDQSGELPPECGSINGTVIQEAIESDGKDGQAWLAIRIAKSFLRDRPWLFARVGFRQSSESWNGLTAGDPGNPNGYTFALGRFSWDQAFELTGQRTVKDPWGINLFGYVSFAGRKAPQVAAFWDGRRLILYKLQKVFQIFHERIF